MEKAVWWEEDVCEWVNESHREEVLGDRWEGGDGVWLEMVVYTR